MTFCRKYRIKNERGGDQLRAGSAAAYRPVFYEASIIGALPTHYRDIS